MYLLLIFIRSRARDIPNLSMNDHDYSKYSKRIGGLNMKKLRHYLAGSIFAALGIIFLYLDMPSTTDHINHSQHISHDITGHDVTLLGIGEMTWMWFTMALVHFFLNDRG